MTLTEKQIQALSSKRFAANALEKALAGKHGWQVLSAVRAEDETRFFDEAVLAAAEYALARRKKKYDRDDNPWTILGHTNYGSDLGEAPCDHLAARDIKTIVDLIADVTAEDVRLLVRAVELGDEEAIAAISKRFRSDALVHDIAIYGHRRYCLHVRCKEENFPNYELNERALNELERLNSTPVGCKRLYRVIRPIFESADVEFEFLIAGTRDARMMFTGACAILADHDVEWPEIFPMHFQRFTHAMPTAIRALSFAALTAKRDDFLKALMPAPEYKSRVETVGLPWEQRFFGVGSKVVQISRYQHIVLSLVGKANPDVPEVPFRPRYSKKIHKTADKAMAFFDKQVADLTKKHDLKVVDPSTLDASFQRVTGSPDSDYALALLAIGAKWPESEALPLMFRGDPELTRRLIARQELKAEDVKFDDGRLGIDVRDFFGSYQEYQCLELLLELGARPTAASARNVQEAAERGGYLYVKRMMEAGAPTPKANEETAKWPRLHALIGG